MQFIFVDIEGANNYNFLSKMCTFGYVVTDINFNVNSKIDVIMNPESVFDKHLIKNKMNAYPIEKYYSSPSFPYFYKSIKNILEKKEQLIIGWSFENDVRFIYDACKRYKLKQIKYEYLDLQKVIMKLENITVAPNLEATAEKYNLEIQIAHKSDDDAFLTMKIADCICKQQNMSLIEMYDQYKDCISNVDEYSKHVLTNKEIQERIKKRKVSFAISRTIQRNHFSNPLINQEDVFGFSMDVIMENTDDVCKMVHYIVDCGGKCSNEVSKCNKVIYKNKLNNISHNNKQLISYDEIMEIIRNNYKNYVNNK